MPARTPQHTCAKRVTKRMAGLANSVMKSTSALEHGLPTSGESNRARGQKARDRERRQREEQEDPAERGAAREHHRDRAHERDRARYELQHAALQHLGDLVEVVRSAADDVSGLVRVEVRQRQAPDLGRDLPPQPEVQALGEARHDERGDGVEEPRRGPDAEVGEDLAPAVAEGGHVVAARGPGGLDVSPQQIDEARRVADGGKGQDDVAHRARRRHDEAPALGADARPQAPRGAHGVGRDVLGAHLRVVLLVVRIVVSHPGHLPSLGTRRSRHRPGMFA